MRILRLACAVPVAVAPMVVRADVVFNDLTTPTSSSVGFGVCGIGGCGSFSQSIASAFTPTANYFMSDAKVQTFAFASGTDNNFDAFLYTNSMSGVPGSQIAALGSGITAPAFGGGPNVMLEPPIALTLGTEYWLVLTPADANSSLSWEDGGSQANAIPLASSTSFINNGAWVRDGSSSSQFEIDGTLTSGATPEPAALFVPPLMLLGVVGLIRRNRRSLQE